MNVLFVAVHTENRQVRIKKYTIETKYIYCNFCVWNNWVKSCCDWFKNGWCSQILCWLKKKKQKNISCLLFFFQNCYSQACVCCLPCVTVPSILFRLFYWFSFMIFSSVPLCSSTSKNKYRFQQIHQFRQKIHFHVWLLFTRHKLSAASVKWKGRKAWNIVRGSCGVRVCARCLMTELNTKFQKNLQKTH